MCSACSEYRWNAGIIRLWALPLVLFALSACEREKREFHSDKPSEPAHSLQMTALRAGGAQPLPTTRLSEEKNAHAMSEGKELYTNFNCSTCHAHGGGDIGPPLKDDVWIYGSDPAQIFASIVEGRPNGMPAFRERIVEPQVWQIVAYVRSMSGLASKNAAPGRLDHIQDNPPENSVDPQSPTQSGIPKSAEMPR
jgi:cytochrome c oxidase cbb3-type subunit 3